MRWGRNNLAIWAAAAGWLVSAGAAGAADPARYAVKARGYLAPDGRLVRDVTMLVQNGRIVSIGKDVKTDAGWPVFDCSKKYLGPGLVDLHTALGAGGRTEEAANAVESAAEARDLFNRFGADFDRAVRAGITTVVLAPSSRHLVGGSTAVVKTAGDDGQKRVVGRGPLKLSLSSEAFSNERVPTSLQGAIDELSRLIEAARADRRDDSPFAAWARGEAPAIVDVNDAEGLTLLARFAREKGVKCVPLHGNFAVERLDDLKSLTPPVILGTYEFSDPLRFTRTPAMLHEAGIGFAFTSNAPRYPPELLRAAIAIAGRQGLPLAAGQAAVTTAPAELLGLADRIGSLKAGSDADFVVTTGHPLMLTSRVTDVFIDGRRVWSEEDESGAAAGGRRASR